MKWVDTAWRLLRDVLMTGSGLALIFWEAFSGHPDQGVIWGALVLLAPAGVQHAVTLYLSGQSAPGPGPSESSPPSPSPSSSPPVSSSPGAPGE